jgi:hypothetical protein
MMQVMLVSSCVSLGNFGSRGRFRSYVPVMPTFRRRIVFPSSESKCVGYVTVRVQLYRGFGPVLISGSGKHGGKWKGPLRANTPPPPTSVRFQHKDGLCFTPIYFHTSSFLSFIIQIVYLCFLFLIRVLPYNFVPFHSLIFLAHSVWLATDYATEGSEFEP